MKINRNNYEEYFMLYADKELSATDRREVEEFVQQNPDLALELTMFTQSVLKADDSLLMPGKEFLYRDITETEDIDITNYETYFISYADGELSNAEQAMVEKYVYAHPELQAEFELFQQAKLSPDHSVVFENKSSLYRSEKDEKAAPIFISFTILRWAAAALVVIAAGFWWYNASKQTGVAGGLVKSENIKKIQVPGNNTEHLIVTPTEEHKQTMKEAVAEVSSTKSEPVVSSHNTQSARVRDTGARLQGPASSKEPAEPLLAAITEVPHAKEPVVVPVAEPATATKIASETLVYVNTDKPDNGVTYANMNNAPKDDLLLSNTALKKGTLRGIFRKASRFVQRTARTGQDEEPGLVGSIAMALH